MLLVDKDGNIFESEDIPIKHKQEVARNKQEDKSSIWLWILLGIVSVFFLGIPFLIFLLSRSFPSNSTLTTSWGIRNRNCSLRVSNRRKYS